MLKNYVQENRKAIGLTQEELAHAIGVTRQTIISIEKGNYLPSVLLALKLSQVLLISVEDLFVLK